jgi:hypothetical protein
MSKPLKLITESDIFDYELITEAHDPTKPTTFKMRGIYIQADVINGNNRKYDYGILKEAVDKFIEEKIVTNTALEEFEHPQELTINPDRVCARTLSLVEDNKCWIGESIILASDPKFGIVGTPCGDLLKSLLQHGVAIGHSTRGVGNVNEDNVVDEYQLVCIDTVLSPSIGIFNNSNANRFTNGILESKDFMINTHGEILEMPYKKFEKRLSKRPNTFISEKKNMHLSQAVHDFFESLL